MGAERRGVWLVMTLAGCTSSSSGASVPEAGGSEASVSCPETQPASQTPCSLAPGTPCTYGDLCAPSVFVCTGSAWDDVTPSTRPPPPCPPTLPVNGSTCAACASTYRCDYNLECAADGGDAGIGTCAGGHWLVGAACGD